MLNGNCLAVRRIQRLIHVVDILRVRIVEAVELQDDVLGQLGSRRRDTTSSCQIHMIVVAHLLDVTYLEDSPVQRTIETIAQFLCHVTQVQVVVGNLTHVHVLTEIGVRGVRCTIEDSLSVCQVTIRALSGRSTRENCYFKLATSLMLSHSELSQFLCCCLGHTSWCEATHGDVFAIFNQCRSLCGSQSCITHNYFKFANFACKVTTIFRHKNIRTDFFMFLLFFCHKKASKIIHQHVPDGNNVTDTTCEHEEVEYRMHVFFLVQ